ncbi:hypothetical protein NUW58_g3797 [Xylaria curta]|uniref:Uncharacterized protein n=1 Tax=Xylaria curta TaxID=42375 RepID=A0ACC1PAS5_9PEZI|nr:hypothetical protein NUW58_g3797 [Xylaria curta]
MQQDDILLPAAKLCELSSHQINTTGTEIPTPTRPDVIVRERLGLGWNSARRDAFFKTVKVVEIKRLSKPYPQRNCYVAGTPTAKAQWDTYWRTKPLDRVRRTTMNLEKHRLQYIVPQNESVIFRDADTHELILVVIRHLVPEEGIRKSMVDVCQELMRSRCDDRQNDPGRMVHFGYTCGSRYGRQIQLATPNMRMDTPATQRREERLNVKAQGMAGIVWNLMRSKLPPEIISDYNDMINEEDFPRMDMGRDDEAFMFQVEDRKVTFYDLELPPPSALAAINYARHTHIEANGNNWIVAYTANAPGDPDKGGNFYVASYGIMVEAASNAASAWRPSDYHGTTLYEMAEKPAFCSNFEARADGDFNTGFVFELSKAFRGARRNSQWLDNRRAAQRRGKRARELGKGHGISNLYRGVSRVISAYGPLIREAVIESLISYKERRFPTMASLETTDRHLVLIGVGPGIGRSVARLFASKRYRNVTLIARRPEQLKIEQVEVEAAVGLQLVKVKTYTVDIADSGALTNALVDAEATFGKPECVYYNAARVIPSKLLSHDVREIEYDFKLTVSALYTTAQWAIPLLAELAKEDPSAKPALVVTGGVLHVQPDPELFALSLVKAAQRNLVQSLAATYGAMGVRVGMILVAGVVAPEEKERNPENIAVKAWEWFSDDKEVPFEIVI